MTCLIKYVPNETQDLNLGVLNMIKGVNKSKILKKHILFECKCKFDGRKCNNDKCRGQDKK